MHLKVRHLGSRLRQQPDLQLASQRQVPFQTLFLLRNLLVQSRIFDRNRDLRGQRGQRPLVVFGEVSAPRVLQVENADDRSLVNERNCQLRTRLRIQQKVARVLADIGGENSFLGLGRVANQPFANRDVVLQAESFLKALRKSVLQRFAGRVHQQDAEHLVVD